MTLPQSQARIVAGAVDGIAIPFRRTFRHNLAERNDSASVIVRLVSDTGAVGFGEGLPRPYVTGETVASCLAHIRDVMLAAVVGVAFPPVEDLSALTAAVKRLLPIDERGPHGVAWNAARCAVETALLDCLWRSAGRSLSMLLPPIRSSVTYSGVLSGDIIEESARSAARMRAMGLRHVKIKVARKEDAARVHHARDVLGSDVSLRIDANGAFDADGALAFLDDVRGAEIACCEQPVPAGDIEGMAAVRRCARMPVMADESLVTLRDAERLVTAGACDLFNLRLSKCGGILPTLALAALAARAGVGCQLGCQVGESAILSAAGRHVACHLDGLVYVEGSYGEYLLDEDVADQSVAFGRGGVAPALGGPGLGITVRDEVVRKHAWPGADGGTHA